MLGLRPGEAVHAGDRSSWRGLQVVGKVAVFFELGFEIAQTVVELVHRLLDASQTAMKFIHGFLGRSTVLACRFDRGFAFDGQGLRRACARRGIRG